MRRCGGPCERQLSPLVAEVGGDLQLVSGARLQSFLAHLKCLLPLDLVERPLGVPKPSPPEVSEALAGEQVAESRIGSV